MARFLRQRIRSFAVSERLTDRDRGNITVTMDDTVPTSSLERSEWMTGVEDSGATILLVEDDPTAARLMREILEEFGYQVLQAEDGAGAQKHLRQGHPDLIVLDLMLPQPAAPARDLDPGVVLLPDTPQDRVEDSRIGLDLCAALKRIADVPIIICSATSRKLDARLGFRLGADDFIRKPFDIEDFLDRVGAVLRRVARTKQAQPAAPADQIRIDDLLIDRSRRHVALGGEEVRLTPAEFSLLSALASRPNTVLTRDELAQAIWGDQGVGRGQAIDTHILRLRAKLSASSVPAPSIVSARGFGYKLVMASARTASSPSPA